MKKKKTKKKGIRPDRKPKGILLCPECEEKIKFKKFSDGYKACAYCGLILYKPPFATADKTIIPELKHK